MRKPNYSMERKDRERAKQAKAAAKQDKRETRNSDGRADSVAGVDEAPAGGSAEASEKKA